MLIVVTEFTPVRTLGAIFPALDHARYLIPA
jgi:hypothetical protein